MGPLRLWKHSNGYYYIIHERGRQKSLKTKDLKTAKKIFKKAEKAWLEGRLVKLEKRKLTLLGDFRDEYLGIRKTDQEYSTYKLDRISLKKFIDFFGNRPMAGITPKKLDLFRSVLKSSGLKESSCNIHIRHLKIALKKARQWGYIREDYENPLLEGFKQFKIEKGIPVYASAREVRKLLKVAYLYDKQKTQSKVMRTCTAIMYYAGLARTEICGTLNIQEDIIMYKRAKTKKWVSSPIAKKLRPYIAHLQPGIQRIVPWKSTTTFSHHFANMARIAKLRRITPHKLRHTFATHLLAKGVDIKTISELLGHGSISVTSTFYAHLTHDKKQRAVDKL